MEHNLNQKYEAKESETTENKIPETLKQYPMGYFVAPDGSIIPCGMPQPGMMPPQGTAGMPQPGMIPPQGMAGMPQPGMMPPQGMAGMPQPGMMPPQGMAGMPQPGMMPMQGMAGMPQLGVMPMPGMAGMPQPGMMPMQGMAGMPQPGMVPPQGMAGMPQPGMMPMQGMAGMPQPGMAPMQGMAGMPQPGMMPMQGMTGMPQPGMMSPQGMVGMPQPGRIPPQGSMGKTNGTAPIKKKKNLEDAVGKNLMGIMASILIFAGLTLLATMAYDAFSDAMRVAGIFVISAIMLAVGRIGMQKNRNAFFLSMTGCGVGAVYISLFLTYGYFGYLNEIILYLLLAVWSVIVYFMGGRDSQLFKVIGQVGLLVSLIFGVAFLVGEETEKVKGIYVLISFYISLSVFYLCMDRRKGMKVNAPSLIMNGIGAFLLYTLLDFLRYVEDFPNFALILTTILLEAYQIFLVALVLRRIDREEKPEGGFFAAYLGSMLGITILGNLLANHSELVHSLTALPYLLVLWLMVEKRNKKDIPRVVCLSMLFAYSVLCFYGLEMFSDLLGTAALALPLGIVAFVKKEHLYMILSLVSYGLFVVFNGEYTATYLLLTMAYLLLYIVFLLNEETIYKAGYKITLYVLAEVCLLRLLTVLEPKSLSMAELFNIIFLISSVLCIVASLSFFVKSWTKGHTESGMKIFMAIITGKQILVGMVVLFFKVNEVFHFFNALVLLALMILNIPAMIKQYKDHAFCGFYIGGKLTLYLIVTLLSYEAAGFVVSLCCLIMAISVIAAGFGFRYRYIRLYGLILSIFSIVKLVLFDVEYHSSAARAVTVTVCGLIAFGISFLYNVLDKRILQETTVLEKKQENNQG